MPLHNVHIYREMRLFFAGIEAATPAEAARIASDKPTIEADATEGCEGENLAALVDVVGDAEFEHSVTIDFEAEHLRKAAATLRDTLDRLATAAADLDAAIDGVTDQFDSERAELLAASRKARSAIAPLAAEQPGRRQP